MVSCTCRPECDESEDAKSVRGGTRGEGQEDEACRDASRGGRGKAGTQRGARRKERGKTRMTREIMGIGVSAKRFRDAIKEKKAIRSPR